MYDFDVRHTIKQVIPILEKLIHMGKSNLGIYTYGNIGQFIDKEILQKQYGIFPKLIIDNKSFDGKTILNLKQAKEQLEDNIIYLICSENEKYYDDIRNAIYSVLPQNQIVDLFPDRPIQITLDDEELDNTLSIIEGWIEELENVK